MPSPALAYPNSRSNAVKKTASPFGIAGAILASDLPRGPRNTLAAWYRVAGSPIGNEILLFTANKGVEMEAGVSERTARNHRRILEKLGAVTLKYRPNSRIRADYFRHTATYRFNVENLRPRPSYDEYRKSRKIAEEVPAGPKPVQSSNESGIRSAARTRKAPPLSTGQRKELVRRIAELANGYTRHVDMGGLEHHLRPDDPRYRAPMDKAHAVIEACKSMCESHGCSLDRAIEAAKDAGFDIVSGSA